MGATLRTDRVACRTFSCREGIEGFEALSEHGGRDRVQWVKRMQVGRHEGRHSRAGHAGGDGCRGRPKHGK